MASEKAASGLLEDLLVEVERRFGGRVFLTEEHIRELLEIGSEENVVQNWTKRSDPKRRPPRIAVGKEVRFPTRPFIRWLVQEQSLNAE